MSSLVFVGIDVSHARLDLAVRPGTPWSVQHDEAAIATVVEQLTTLRPTLIVLEATGGIPLTSALATAGLPVVVVNPRQVRDFARATGLLAKTDALDAQVLAQFAEVTRPQPRPLLQGAGKAKKVALTACMRTLLTILNTMLKHRTPWRPIEAQHV